MLPSVELLSDEELVAELREARLHAEKTLALWRCAVNEDDPASDVRFKIAMDNGQMYLIIKSLVDARTELGKPE